MSRIGKIARLPKAVREELNRRLEDGEQQNRLVEWLNGREDVQAVLKAEFTGRPINEPNLTAWVQGGYEDWRRQQESLEAAGRMVEETAALDVMAGDRRLADRAADMAALALGEQLMAIRRMEDGAEKRRAVLKIVRGLVRLRKSDRECERGHREAAQAERAAEIHDHWAEGARRRRSADARSQRSEAEHEYEHEHEIGDVRARMAEVIAGMSDPEIAESLRRSGHMGRQDDAGARPSFAKASTFAKATADRPAEHVWWTDEDEALEGTEFEDDKESDEGDEADAGRTPEAEPTTSTLLRQGFGGQDGGQASMSAGGPGTSGHPAPPTDQTDPASGGLREA